MPINNYNNDQISYLDKDKRKKKSYLLTISIYALHKLLSSNIYKTKDIWFI